jgi:hypothetical protein
LQLPLKKYESEYMFLPKKQAELEGYGASFLSFFSGQICIQPYEKKDAYYKFSCSARDYSVGGFCCSSSIPNRIHYFGRLTYLCFEMEGWFGHLLSWF